MANKNLTNQRQVFVEEYVRSGDHLEAAKKAGYKDQLVSLVAENGTELLVSAIRSRRRISGP